MAKDMKMGPLALNGRFSGTVQPTGTQTVAFCLFDAIIRMERDWPIVVFADPRYPGVEAWEKFPLTTLVNVPLQDWSRGRAQLWEQLVLPILSRRWGCRLIHHPMNSSPIWKRGTKTVVTLHDLNFYLHPEWYSFAFSVAYRFCSLPGLRRADRVVTVSNYVRDQAIRTLNLPENKVKGIYNGIKSLPRPGDDEEQESPPYLLCVGSLEPHKNLACLIRAYQKIREEFPDLQLWIAGRAQANFRTQPELGKLLSSPGIRLLGYLSDSDLSAAYQKARAFCYPSLEEGFGLPLLEAMEAGTLVVTSQASCLPEIAGPFAEFVDPYEEESIADGLRRVLLLPSDQRTQRLKQARAWSGQFTWQRAAREYALLYKELSN